MLEDAFGSGSCLSFLKMITCRCIKVVDFRPPVLLFNLSRLQASKDLIFFQPGDVSQLFVPSITRNLVELEKMYAKGCGSKDRTTEELLVESSASIN